MPSSRPSIGGSRRAGCRYSSEPPNGWDIFKVLPFAQESQDLRVGVDPLLDAAVELHEPPVLVNDGAIALLDFQHARSRSPAAPPAPADAQDTRPPPRATPGWHFCCDIISKIAARNFSSCTSSKSTASSAGSSAMNRAMIACGAVLLQRTRRRGKAGGDLQRPADRSPCRRQST